MQEEQEFKGFAEKARRFRKNISGLPIYINS